MDLWDIILSGSSLDTIRYGDGTTLKLSTDRACVDGSLRFSKKGFELAQNSNAPDYFTKYFR
jgi:hypothetical protein